MKSLISTSLFLILFAAIPADARAQSVPFSLPEGWNANLFAREPMFANPVALSVSADGKVYVTQTRRRKAQNLDIRNNADWIETELSLNSIADKEAFYRSELTPEKSEQNRRRVEDLNNDGVHDWRDLTVLSESIHELADLNGDGVADRATTFADGFQSIITGVAAGVLSHDGHVYTTISPDVWKLTDVDGDGVADRRQSIARGFSVHVAYAGHNMHGLIMGPDGRLYWSIGDIGSDYYPNEGALFRCNPDGSDFEVYARGLRNPQEVGFNELGDIMTGDNDGDFGDLERWYHIVEGGNYGWKNWWQYQVGEKWGSPKGTYSVWLREKLWNKWFPEMAAYVIPPVDYIAGGPCGMSFYPGTGLGSEWENTFFLAHFTGSANNSGIFAYRAEPDGATYKLTRNEKVIGGLVATGVDFAPDGSALYLADWSGGWDLNDQGKVWKLYDPLQTNSGKVLESRRLLTGEMSSRSVEELKTLLGHENMNVRREAQFALAGKGETGRESLAQTAHESPALHARLHAIWGLGQLARGDDTKSIGILRVLLADEESEVRAQAAKALGEAHDGEAYSKLIELLKDPEPRPQYFAAISIGKLRRKEALPILQDWIANLEMENVILRHAGVMAFTWINDVETLIEARRHPSDLVRLASVVALRKLESPEARHYLHDSNPLIVLEAARAINDLPLEQARPDLAELIQGPMNDEALARRVLNANFRIGRPLNAARLAAFAARPGAAEELRLEAIRMLADWERPSPRDRVVGGWFPHVRPERNGDVTRNAVEENLIAILNGGDELRTEAARLASKMKLSIQPQTMLNWVEDARRSAPARLAGLTLLAESQSPLLKDALETALSDSDPKVKFGALNLYSRIDPAKTLALIQSMLNSSSTEDRQNAVRLLAEIPAPGVDSLLNQLIDRVEDIEQHPEDAPIQLEVIEAAQSSPSRSVNRRIRRWIEPLGPEDKLQWVLHGGDYERGREIFLTRTDLQCLRCHSSGDMPGNAGGNVAPNLAGIGGTKSRRYLAESIVFPNKAFAEGYEMTLVETKDGSFIAGRILDQTPESIHIEIPAETNEYEDDLPSEPETVSIPAHQIQKQEKGLSAMPEGLNALMSSRDLRDLVEYVARQ